MTLEATFELTPHGLTQQHKRRLGHSTRETVRLDAKRAKGCRASADINNSSRARPAVNSRNAHVSPADVRTPSDTSAPRVTKTGLQPETDVAPDSEASPGINPRLASAAKMVVGGAVAMAALAVGYEFGAHLVTSLESVPPLAHLELIIGTLVSARAIALYLGDTTARIAVDGSVISAVAGLQGAVSLPDRTNPVTGDTRSKRNPVLEDTESNPSTVHTPDSSQATAAEVMPSASTSPPRRHADVAPPSGPKSTPTMLEVEIRCLVDEAMASALDTPDPSVVTVDRRALVEAVAEYIRKREEYTREGLERVREELEESETLKLSLMQLTKTREARRARRAAELIAMERLKRIQEVNSRILATPQASESLEVELAGSLGRLDLDTTEEKGIEHPTESTEASTEEDDLEAAKERARKFRAKLDAMKKSRDQRAQDNGSS